MSGYVFLGNSTKPTKIESNSRDKIKLNNVGRPCLQAALDMGYEVYLGVNREKPDELICDELPIHFYDSHTYRSITALRDNWIAYRNLCDIVKKHNVEVIHCNSPVGGMIGRLVGRKYHVNKVIYTAHGFHFYKGAPFLNCTIYKLAEQIMAHWTDVIITMNQEDFEAAQKFRLKKDGRVYKIHGVGIKIENYQNMNFTRNAIRKELRINPEDIICISAGDLVKRKNYPVAIHAVAQSRNPAIHYLICGEGPEKSRLEKLAKELHVEKQVHLLGFRTDIKNLFASSDIFLFTTKQEGLPRSMMEAMASGLPCVVSKIRGNIDLLEGTNGGFLCQINDISDYADKLNILANDPEMRSMMGRSNLLAIRNFSEEIVSDEIRKIYRKELVVQNVS